ncbi:MAG: MATE family efflux transporter [Candidatus Altiarchaeota archaeon]
MGNDLTDGSVFTTILAASWPMMIAFGLQSTFNIVDAYFVGRISADALAAVSVSFPVVFLIISLSTGVGVGTTSLIARYIGRRDYASAGEVAEHAFVISIALSVFFMFTGLITAPSLFGLMDISALVKDLSLDYINIILVGSPIMFLAMVGNSIIRGRRRDESPNVCDGIFSSFEHNT